MSGDRRDGRAGDAHFREEAPAEYEEGVQDDVEDGAEELSVHAVKGETRRLQEPLHADLAADADAEQEADV